MKKMILALTVMCLTGVAFANQQCFFGRNCVNGRIVERQERAHKKNRMKHGGCPMMKQQMMMQKEGCPMMKKEGKPCAMRKAGKPCGCQHKMKKGKKGGEWKREGRMPRDGKRQDFRKPIPMPID